MAERVARGGERLNPEPPMTRSQRLKRAIPGFASCCALFFAITSGNAAAQVNTQANPQASTRSPDTATQNDVPPATIERDVHLFVVQADGSAEEDDDTVLRANTTAGVEQIAQRYVWFNKDIETITQLSAETIDPDGTAHAVDASGIRDVQEPRSAGAPTFEDGVLRTVIFPGVQVGSRVHLHFAKRRAKALQAGTFSYFVEPDAGVPVEFQRLIFDLPANLPLHADARGYVALAPATANGRTRYAFDYQHGPYAPLEAGAVAYVNWGDRLMVSTVPDFATFAARYREAAADATASDPAIVALAQSLTAGVSDPYEKARRLYDWMRFNIRYVALFLGETAAVPHRAADILRNRYGDCKDHVALFTALLAAVGIRAETAMVNLGPVYSLPDVPGYGAHAINHVITWLPDLGVFADTSSGGYAFGYLPPAVTDKPALLVGEGVLTRTPASERRERSARLALSVDASGDAAYRYYVQDEGAGAEPERNTFRRATHAGAQQLAAQRLRLTGLPGSARVSTSPTAVTDGPFSATMEGTLDHLVWRDGTTAIPALSSFTGGIATQIDSWLAQPRRTQPWACIGGEFEETAQIELPAFARVTDVPQDTSVSEGPLAFTSHYVLDARSRTLQIERRLSARFDHQMCSAEEFAQMRDALVRIERDTHAQIVVRAKGNTG
jgi:transglutaminase-like putative cysteine protease